jgi:hypothetical protein
MDQNDPSPYLVGFFTPEDLSYHRNGRLREDADGILLSARESIAVSSLPVSFLNFI